MSGGGKSATQRLLSRRCIACKKPHQATWDPRARGQLFTHHVTFPRTTIMSTKLVQTLSGLTARLSQVAALSPTSQN